MLKKGILGIVGLLCLIGIDQFSKYLAIFKLKDTSGITIIPSVFRLQYLENRGAAFGVFENQRWFLLIGSLIIFIAISLIYFKLPTNKKYRPLNLVCIFIGAGAIGNMLDRFLHGYVIDYFDFCLIDFPIFNVADCYVTVSCFVVLILILFIYKDDDFKFKNNNLDGKI